MNYLIKHYEAILYILVILIILSNAYGNETSYDYDYDQDIMMLCNDKYCSEHNKTLSDQEAIELHNIEYNEYLKSEHLRVEIDNLIGE